MQQDYGGGSVLKPRTQRFPIQVPLEYRVTGEAGWNEGTTINISRSGVLFRSVKEIEPATPVSMKILFPANLTGGSGVNLMCWGHIVRSEPAEPIRALAATIDHSRLKRTKRPIKPNR